MRTEAVGYTGVAKSGAHLEALRWLFLVVLGVALTNGTRIFWTGSLSGVNLRSPSALFGNLDFVYFLVFVAEVVMTALGGVFLLQDHYSVTANDRSTEARTDRPRHVLDAFVLVITGILFNGVSVALTHTRDDPWPYFILFGFIFGLLTVWFVILAFGALRGASAKLRRQVGVETLRLLLPLLLGGIGAIVLVLGVLHLPDLLLVPVALDVVLAGLRQANWWFPSVFATER
jgi:hypothetical protein